MTQRAEHAEQETIFRRAHDIEAGGKGRARAICSGRDRPSGGEA